MISTNDTLNLCNLHEHLPGSFGYDRKNHIHEGVDLYGNENQDIYPFVAGVVIDVYNFTGASVGMPWWNETQAIAIADDTGVWVYGEMETTVTVGSNVATTDVIGTLKRVLKKDKGLPTTMLHVERWKTGYTPYTFLWELNTPQPDFICDPTPLLLTILENKCTLNQNSYTQN